MPSTVHVRSHLPTITPRRIRGNLGPIDRSLLDVDEFHGLLVRAGVPPYELPPDGRRLMPHDASRLLARVLMADVSLRDFGPWRMVTCLLVEAVRNGVPVSREEMGARMQRLSRMLVLRPDGYLVEAATGQAVQYVGQVRFWNGGLRVEAFEVGPFYAIDGRFLRPVMAGLMINMDVSVGQYAPDHGTLGPALEGAGKAVVEAVVGLVSLVVHPIDSAAGLAQIPTAVRALIESAPECWERFRAMPHSAQVREVSRLLTHVLMTAGTAGVGSARLGTAGAQLGKSGVPVLSLSRDGALALSAVVVPAGTVAMEIGAAVGAVYVLHMANVAGWTGGTPPVGGPGEWIPKNEGMEEPARRYQHQISGAPHGWVYRVRRDGEYADFDNFRDGILVEAKGPGYDKFLDGDDSWRSFFSGSDGILDQARRQVRVANGTHIRWYVAETRVAAILRTMFAKARIAIEVIHTPIAP